jgi:CrcB protein
MRKFPQQLLIVILVFFGGAVGAMSRYAIGEAIKPSEHSLGSLNVILNATLLINVVACFIAGLIFVKINNIFLKPLLLTGFCGGFSTLAAVDLMIETNSDSQNLPLAIANLIINIILGLGAAIGAMTIASRDKNHSDIAQIPAFDKSSEEQDKKGDE